MQPSPPAAPVDPLRLLPAFPQQRQQSLSGTAALGTDPMPPMSQDHPLYARDSVSAISAKVLNGLRGGPWDRKKPQNDLQSMVAEVEEQWRSEDDISPVHRGAPVQEQVPSYYQPPPAVPAINGAPIAVPTAGATATGANVSLKTKRSLLSGKEVHLLLLHASRLGDVHALRSLLRSPKMTPHMCDDHGRTPLMFASFGGHEECVLFLLSSGALVHETDFAGRTALHYACLKGYINVIEALLKANANVWIQDHQGKCSLHCVAEQESVETLDLVWKYGRMQLKGTTNAPIKLLESHLLDSITKTLAVSNDTRSVMKHNPLDFCDDDGMTPLMSAVVKGNMEMVRALVKYGADPALTGPFGRTALHFAVFNNHTTITQFLVSKVPDLTHRSDTKGYSPVHLAAQIGQLSQLYFLIAHDPALARAQTNDGKTCVHLAIDNAHQSSLNLLAQLSVPLDIPDTHGQQPIHTATLLNYRDCIAILLKHDISIDSANSEGKSPLHIACEKGSSETVKFLIQRRADVNTVDKAGETPLHIAASFGHTSICLLLIKENPLPIKCQREQQTPLFKAALNGHAETVLALVNDKEKNVFDVDGKGRTLLHICAAKGFLDMSALFLKIGINIHAKDKKGATALHEAAFHGRSEVLLYLLQQGAEISTQDTSGVTALHWAAVNGHLRCCETLLDFGAPINIMDNDADRGTPLDYAYLNDNLPCVELIKNRGGLRAVEISESTVVDKKENNRKLLNQVEDETKRDSINRSISPLVPAPTPQSNSTSNPDDLSTTKSKVSIDFSRDLNIKAISKSGAFERITKSLDRSITFRSKALSHMLTINGEPDDEQEKLRETLNDALDRIRQMKLQTVNSSVASGMEPVTSSEIQNSLHKNSTDRNLKTNAGQQLLLRHHQYNAIKSELPADADGRSNLHPSKDGSQHRRHSAHMG